MSNDWTNKLRDQLADYQEPCQPRLVGWDRTIACSVYKGW